MSKNRTAEDYVWHRRLFCACGWSKSPAFGDPWYIATSMSVCPDCGAYLGCHGVFNELSEGWEMKTVKWIDGDVIKTPWYRFNGREPGYWEERKESD